MQKTEIALSKAKLSKLLFFCVLFVACGLWIIIKDPQTSNPIFGNIIVKTFAAYGSVLMGLLGIYFFSVKLFDKKPGIILDENGIYENASAFKFGFIPWSDISGVYERTVQVSASKQHFVTLRLVDPEKYIGRETNAIKKKLMRVNANSYGSPVHISANGLKTNQRELLALVEKYFNQSQHNITETHD